MLDILKNRPGCTVGELASHFDVSRIAVMNHLAVLEKATLVISRRTGRRRCLYLNAAPLQSIQQRWVDDYGAFWSHHLLSIQFDAEKQTKENHDE